MGTLQFRDSKILLAYSRKMAFSGNCCRQCGCCPEGYGPEEVLVQFSGITNGDCDLCEMLNDSFVLPFESGDCWPCNTYGRGLCAWRYDFAPNDCEIQYIRFEVVGHYVPSPGLHILASVLVSMPNGNIFFRNIYDPGEMPNCTELDEEPLGYALTSSTCDSSVATCLVSALS